MAIIQTGRTEGLSVASVLLELVGYSISFSYAYVSHFPLATYGESILLAVHLLFLYWYDSRRNKSQLAILSVIYVCLELTFLSGYLPVLIVQGLMLCTTAIFLTSNILQIIEIRKNGDAGQVSEVSWALANYVCVVRLLTTYFLVGDMIVLINYIVAIPPALYILILILYYKYH